MNRSPPALRIAALCLCWLLAGAAAAETPAETAPASAPPNMEAPRGRQRVEAFWSQRTLGTRLAMHDPIYFIGGRGAPEAKFQFSFKYQLATFKEAPERASHTLQFAYTQRSLWDIGSESSPFYDTSYMPELMYQLVAPASVQSAGPVSWLGLQTGFAHESNGKPDPTSRSLNKLFLRSAFTVGEPDDWHVVLTPTVYTYVGDLSDNADLRRYRNVFELRTVLARSDNESLQLTWIPGRGLSRGSRQYDLSIPVRIKAIKFGTFLQVQYFDGYGESLLSYNERTSSLRMGIALVR